MILAIQHYTLAGTVDHGRQRGIDTGEIGIVLVLGHAWFHVVQNGGGELGEVFVVTGSGALLGEENPLVGVEVFLSLWVERKHLLRLPVQGEVCEDGPLPDVDPALRGCRYLGQAKDEGLGAALEVKGRFPELHVVEGLLQLEVPGVVVQAVNV